MTPQRTKGKLKPIPRFAPGPEAGSHRAPRGSDDRNRKVAFGTVALCGGRIGEVRDSLHPRCSSRPRGGRLSGRWSQPAARPWGRQSPERDAEQDRRRAVGSGRLDVTVRDTGRWRRTRKDPLRGFGLKLMQSLMDTITIDQRDDGTRIEMTLIPRARVSSSSPRCPADQAHTAPSARHHWDHRGDTALRDR